MTRPRVLLAVCTFRRNDGLRALLRSWQATAAQAPGAEVGVVIVDDSPDGQAEVVATEFEGMFPLDVHYRRAGKQNISFARNVGLTTAIELADWVAMTDDDCALAEGWLPAMLDVQRGTSADAVSGPLRCLAPPGAPRWLVEEPFLETEYPPDRSPMQTGATHNSFLSASWLRDHPDQRFRVDLGTVGGEDTVFFRLAHAAGMQIAFAESAVAFETVPLQRSTYQYQLRRMFWHGNSSYVTSVAGGLTTANRMFLVGGNELRRGLLRPFVRLLHGQAPQWRWALGTSLHGFGAMLGRFGVRVRHR